MSEDYARGILTFKSLFVRYGHQELADSLPELPQGSVTSATGEVNAIAAGSSHSPPPERSLPDRAETQTENHHENLSTDMPQEEPMTDDNFTLSGAATLAQDKPDTYISAKYPFWTSEVCRSRRNSLETLGFVFTGLWGVSGL